MLAAACLSAAAQAQVARYGANVTLEQARKVLTAADAEAHKQGWPVAIAIVDTAGNLVLYQRHDNTQTAGLQVARDKAVPAAIYRRPKKVFQDAVAKGGEGTRILVLRGATPVEGSLTLTVDGKIVGAIGVSGATSEQDGMVPEAGTEALKQPADDGRRSAPRAADTTSSGPARRLAAPIDAGAPAVAPVSSTASRSRA